MCLARIEFVSDRQGKGREALIDVARIDRTPSGLRVTDLMGTVAELRGDIRSIDFIESVVRVEDGEGPFGSTQ
jgi:predicted RNA-binding protein